MNFKQEHRLCYLIVIDEGLLELQCKPEEAEQKIIVEPNLRANSD